MSWSRRLCLVGLLLALSACGFTPVHAPGGGGSALRGQVQITPPSTPILFAMNRQLEDQLGRSTPNGAYVLNYGLTTGQSALAITPDNVLQRYHVTGVVTYSLQERASGAVVASGTVENFAAYAATGNTVSAATARRDAETRLVALLANQLVTRLQAQAAGFGS